MQATANKTDELKEIMYILKLYTRVYFEVDDVPFEALRRIDHVIIKGENGYYDVVQGGLTNAKEAIRKLGKNLLCL